MRLTAEIRYPGAAPEAVFAMLVARGFHERKCAATGALAYEVDVRAAGDGSAAVTARRTMPTDDVPDFVRRIVGNTLEVVEHHEWHAGNGAAERSGTLVVEIAGTPVRLTGAVLLGAAPSGDEPGTLHRVDGTLKASVPLIGGKIEKAVEPAIRGAIRVEERTGRAWLAEGTA